MSNPFTNFRKSLSVNALQTCIEKNNLKESRLNTITIFDS